jgi:hypothetical protein
LMKQELVPQNSTTYGATNFQQLSASLRWLSVILVLETWSVRDGMRCDAKMMDDLVCLAATGNTGQAPILAGSKGSILACFILRDCTCCRSAQKIYLTKRRDCDWW